MSWASIKHVLGERAASSVCPQWASTTGLKDLSDPLGFEEISNGPSIGILTTQSSTVTVQKGALRG